MAQSITTGAAATASSIAAFLAAGGRIMLDPKGKLESAIDAGRLLGVSTTESEAEEANRAARVYLSTERRQRGRIAALVAENGTAWPNGWVVWEGR